MTPLAIHMPDHSGGIAAGLAGGFAMFGTILGPVNQALQTIAYTISILAGICSIVSYVSKRRGK